MKPCICGLFTNKPKSKEYTFDIIPYIYDYSKNEIKGGVCKRCGFEPCICR